MNNTPFKILYLKDLRYPYSFEIESWKLYNKLLLHAFQLLPEQAPFPS